MEAIVGEAVVNTRGAGRGDGARMVIIFRAHAKAFLAWTPFKGIEVDSLSGELSRSSDDWTGCEC